MTHTPCAPLKTLSRSLSRRMWKQARQQTLESSLCAVCLFKDLVTHTLSRIKGIRETICDWTSLTRQHPGSLSDEGANALEGFQEVKKSMETGYADGQMVESAEQTPSISVMSGFCPNSLEQHRLQLLSRNLTKSLSYYRCNATQISYPYHVINRYSQVFNSPMSTSPDVYGQAYSYPDEKQAKQLILCSISYHCPDRQLLLLTT